MCAARLSRMALHYNAIVLHHNAEDAAGRMSLHFSFNTSRFGSLTKRGADAVLWSDSKIADFCPDNVHDTLVARSTLRLLPPRCCATCF